MFYMPSLNRLSTFFQKTVFLYCKVDVLTYSVITATQLAQFHAKQQFFHYSASLNDIYEPMCAVQIACVV